MRICLAFVLTFFSINATANWLCNASESSIVHNKTTSEILEMSHKKHPSIENVQCGVFLAVSGISAGHTTIDDYKNTIIVAEDKDERFEVVQRLNKKQLTIFSYEYDYGQYAEFAMKGLDWERGEELQSGPYLVIDIETFETEDGFPIKLLVLEIIQFH